MRTFRLACAPALAVALLTASMLVAPAGSASAQIGVGFNITIAPPALPVYEQPPLPAEGYLWTPGYWDYGEAGYYWVPGTWVQPPTPGLLWTPGYWGWNNGVYLFNRGYWGEHVGFYGGINYGFGYTGFGFFGGEWRGGVFAYNSAFNRFGGVHVTNVYNRTVINNTTINRVSFNGPKGVVARPTPQEAAFASERHVQPTPMQLHHQQAAASNRTLLASVNHGAPAVAATAHPGQFAGPGVVHAAAAAPMAPHPGMAPHSAMAPHAAMAPHTAMAPHGAATPHPAADPGHYAPPAARPAPMAHPAMAPRPMPMAMAHPAMAPRPPQAARPAPHPAEKEHGHRG